MLSAIGESPLAFGTNLSTVTATDVVMAINLARNTIREVNNMGWKYNWEFGYQLVPVGSYLWTGTDGTMATLNIFQTPTGLMRYYVSACEKQSGSRLIDLTVRPIGSLSAASLTTVKDALFEPTGSVAFTSHFSAGGYGWGSVEGDPCTAVVTSAGLNFTGDGDFYRWAAPVNTADVSVQVDITSTVSEEIYCGLLLRLNAGNQSAYQFSLGNSGSAFITYTNSVGTPTVLATAAYATHLAVDVPHTLQFTATGTLLQGFVDGVLIVSVNDSRLTAAGKVGILGTGISTALFTDFAVTYGTPLTGTVFYDRAKNRIGLDSTLYPFLYIDPIWSTDFVNLPEDARRYIAVRASRQLAQQVVSSTELAQFTAQDELFALRDLKRSEGQEDDFNMFDNIESYEMLGDRTPMPQGPIDERSSPSQVIIIET